MTQPDLIAEMKRIVEIGANGRHSPGEQAHVRGLMTQAADALQASEAALLLSVTALERCRELLIIADTDADDLAEYDAATEAVRCNVEEFRLSRSPRSGGKQS